MLENIFNAFLRLIGGLPIKIDDVTFIDPIGIDKWKYIENDHVIIIEITRTSSEPSRIIYADSIKSWLPPHEDEEVTASDKDRIVKKIGFFLSSRDISYRVE